MLNKTIIIVIFGLINKPKINKALGLTKLGLIPRRFEAGAI